MGGRSGNTQTQTTTTSMPALQTENANTMLRDALAYYQTGGPRYHPGNTYVGPTAEQQQARSGAMDYAQGQGQATVNQAVNANNFWMDPTRMSDFSSIPGYDARRQQIINDATRSLTDSTLPVIREDAILNGQFGGTSQQIGEALATARTNEGIAGQLGQLDLGLYGVNAGMADAAMSRAPAMYDLGLTPSRTMEAIGGLNRADAQGQVDADVARWNFEQMRPLLNLQAFQGLTGSAGQYGGTTHTTGTSNATGGNSMALGGLGAIMSLISLFG